MKFEKTSFNGVYKKGDKFFINYWDSTTKKSKRVWAKTAKTAKDANRVLNETKAEQEDIRNGLVSKPLDASVLCGNLDMLAKLFFDARDTKGNEADRGRFSRWVSPKLGAMKHPISQLDIEGYRKWLRVQMVSRGDVEVLIAPKTVNIIMALIKSVMNWGVLSKLVRYPDGVPSVRRLLVDNDRERVLSREEIDILFKELGKCNDSVRLRNMLVVGFGLYTGSRPISYMELRVKDLVIDSDGVPSRVKFSARKGAKAYEVPISDKLARLLMLRLHELEGSSISPNTKLIRGSYSAIQQSVGRVMDRLFNAGLNGYDVRHKVSLYTLRHTAGTMVLKGTNDIYRVSKLLGHSSVVTTQRYAKMSDDALVDGVNLI